MKSWLLFATARFLRHPGYRSKLTTVVRGPANNSVEPLLQVSLGVCHPRTVETGHAACATTLCAVVRSRCVAAPRRPAASRTPSTSTRHLRSFATMLAKARAPIPEPITIASYSDRELNAVGPGSLQGLNVVRRVWSMNRCDSARRAIPRVTAVAQICSDERRSLGWPPIELRITSWRCESDSRPNRQHRTGCV
jgi:hypothetical protein